MLNISATVLTNICQSLKRLRLDHMQIRTAYHYQPPRYRPPKWFVPKERVSSEDSLTLENREFLDEILQEQLAAQEAKISPLAASQVVADTAVVWNKHTRRTGLIGRKIGNYPLWLKNGKKVQTTLIQVVDNHVINYTPPEEYKQARPEPRKRKTNRFGCLLVGAETVDPSTVTKEYCGLFNRVGMLPKRHLCRFFVSPTAAMATGTPLLATHFRVGDYLDIKAKTIDRGFQGVMKRWGFKGMPASHGVTKTHRRPGNIGAGGEKARVWPGTKMPGHMGNSWRILRGVKVLRINTKYNVLWMLGVAIPGETGAMCYMYDTILPLRRQKTAPPYPTHVPPYDIPDEYFDESVHQFEQPTIAYEES